MKDFLLPDRFDYLAVAVKALCAFDDHVRKFRVQSLALEIGHSFKNMANVLVADAIRSLRRRRPKFRRTVYKITRHGMDALRSVRASQGPMQPLQ